MSQLPPDELRALVRQVLADVLPSVAGPAAPGASASAAPSSSSIRPGDRAVRMTSDADLAAFIEEVVGLAQDPVWVRDLRAGRVRYRLETAAPTTAPAPATSAAATAAASEFHVPRGAVTERLVNKAAQSGASLRVGPRAVLTPLARDRARTLGVTIVRESPTEVR